MGVMSATRSTRLAVRTFRANPLHVSATVLPDRVLLRLRKPPLLGRRMPANEPIEVRLADVDRVWLHRRGATVVRTDRSELPPLTVSRWLGRRIAEGANCPIAKGSGRAGRQLVRGWRPPAS